MGFTNEDGLAWLAGLAAQYDEVAREIRATSQRIRAAEAIRGEAGGHSQEAVMVSEAIRQVLGRAKRPLKVREIWQAIQDQKIALRTRSLNPRKLVETTIGNMRERSQIARVPNQGWTLVD